MPLYAALDTALPAVSTLSDCADWSKTVAPFLPAFRILPQQLWQSLGSLDALKHLYVSTNPVVSALALAMAMSPFFLVASEFNRNYSQVDRAWSLLPTLFIAHFATYAHLAGLPTERLDTLVIVGQIWSVSYMDILIERKRCLIRIGEIDVQLLAQRRIQQGV